MLDPALGDLSSAFSAHGWVIDVGTAPDAERRSCVTLTEAGFQIEVSKELRRVFVHSTAHSSVQTLEHVMLDLALPRLLSLDGQIVLHGGLVGTEKSAIGFIAPSGHGKSTLAASLHKRGLPLISDDAILLRAGRDGFTAHRLYPSLRLLPDSLDMLFPAVSGTSMVADYTDKRRVPFAEGPEWAPLSGLFRLATPSKEIRIVRLSPAEACMALITNSFALDTSDAPENRRRFVQATAVARGLPVFDLHYPRDYSALPEVQDQILAALEMARSGASATEQKP